MSSDEEDWSRYFDLDDDSGWLLSAGIGTKPNAVVFDLDDTLIRESAKDLCDESLRVLSFFKKMHCKLFVVSHNDHAEEFLTAAKLEKYFDNVSSTRDKKSTIVLRILENVPTPIIFFDDVQANVIDVSSNAGVHAHLVNRTKGITMRDVTRSLLAMREGNRCKEIPKLLTSAYFD